MYLRRLSTSCRETAGLLWLAICSGLLVVLFQGTPAGAAISGIVRPDGDGTINGNWSYSSPAYNKINDVVTQPTAPSTANYISIGTRDAGTAFFNLGSFPNIQTVTGVTVWIYHNDSNTGTPFSAQLFDGNESTSLSNQLSFGASINAPAWHSVTFNAPNLDQSQMDNLKVRISSTGAGSGKPNTQYIYNLYAAVTYTIPPFVDIVDGSSASVANPFFPFSSTTASFNCQTSSATLGSSTQQIRFSNDSSSQQWSLTMAPTAGAAALWSNGSKQYDYNDPSGTMPGCIDGSDSDGFAGRLSIDPTAGTLTAKSGCTTNGVSKGIASSFNEGSINSITLLSSTTGQLGCYWNITGINMTQTIPPATHNGSYNLNFTLTATSS